MLSILLGAGASADANLPLAAKLTDDVINRVDNTIRPMLEFVRHSMQAQIAARWSRRSYEQMSLQIDSEALYNTVRDLVHRDSLDIAPFVLNWHPLLEHPRPPISRSDALRTVKSAFDFDAFHASNLSRLADLIADMAIGMNLPNSVLIEIERAVIEAVKVTEDTPVDYLANLIQIANKIDGPLVVGTLNYDTTIETACQKPSYPCSDGILGSSDEALGSTRPADVSQHRLDFVGEGIHLYKMHGSTSWTKSGGVIVPPRGNAT